MEFLVCDQIGCLPPKIIPFKAIPATKAFILGDEAEDIAAAGAGSGLVAANIVNGEIDQAIAPIQATYKEPIGDCGEEEVATGKYIMVDFLPRIFRRAGSTIDTLRLANDSANSELFYKRIKG